MRRNAPVQGHFADCPDCFELCMVAYVMVVGMAVRPRDAAAGAEPGEGGGMIGMLGGDGDPPSCPEMQLYPGQGGVGLQGPNSCSLHSKQSLLSPQEHPALHPHHGYTLTHRGKKREAAMAPYC